MTTHTHTHPPKMTRVPVVLLLHHGQLISQPTAVVMNRKKAATRDTCVLANTVEARSRREQGTGSSWNEFVRESLVSSVLSIFSQKKFAQPESPNSVIATISRAYTYITKKSFVKISIITLKFFWNYTLGISANDRPRIISLIRDILVNIK